MIVYCVLCIEHDAGDQVTHIFSTYDKATGYVNKDTQRSHVISPYEIDNPGGAESPFPPAH